MALDDPTLGYGSILEVDEGSGFDRIAKVKDVQGPEETSSDVEVTNLDSVNSRREFIPGLIDPNTLSWDMIFTATEYARLRGIYRETVDWRYTLPEGSVFLFSGYINKLSLTEVVDDVLTADAELKITGDITLTPGS